MKVDFDCMRRTDNVAILGGRVKDPVPENHPAKDEVSRRAYVKVVDDDSGEGDFVSSMVFDNGIDSNCKSLGIEDKFDMNYEMNVVDPVVSVCSKHGDWEACLQKTKVDQAIE